MKDSKNVYLLLNQIDFNIEDYEKEELTDIEKQNLKRIYRNNKRKLNFKRVGTVAMALVLTMFFLLQTSFGKYVYAAVESRISEISYAIGKALNIEKDIKPYVNIIGEIKEDKGIEVKLGEVMIEKDKITFNTIFNTTKPVSSASFKNVDLYINGDNITKYPLRSEKSGSLDDSNTLFYALCSYSIEGIELMEDMEIKLVLQDLEYHRWKFKGTESGRWEFEFVANGKELALKTESFPVDYTFTIDNQIYKLEELEYNPVRQTIKGKREVIGEYTNSHRIELQGYDNLNNKIIFFIKSATPEEVVFLYERNYEFLKDWSDEISSITLAPFDMDFPGGKQVGEAFTIYLK